MAPCTSLASCNAMSDAPEPDVPTYTITYRVRAADLRALNHASMNPHWFSPLLRLLFGLIAIPLLLFVTVGIMAVIERGWRAGEMLADPAFWWIFLKLSPVLIGLCLIGAFVGREIQIRSLNSHLLEDIATFEFREAGIRSSAPNSAADWTWQTITRITRLRNHLILHLSRRFGIVVPRRAFRSPEEFDAFVDYAGQRVVQ